MPTLATLTRRGGNTNGRRGHPYPHRFPPAGETYSQAVHRMAVNAKHRGFRVVARSIDGAYLINSVADPGWRYRVTRSSCECLGFTRSGRCSHYAVLLDHLGQLPAITPPESDDAA